MSVYPTLHYIITSHSPLGLVSSVVMTSVIRAQSTDVWMDEADDVDSDRDVSEGVDVTSWADCDEVDDVEMCDTEILCL